MEFYGQLEIVNDRPEGIELRKFFLCEILYNNKSKYILTFCFDLKETLVSEI